MATYGNPLAPNPDTSIDSYPQPDPEPQEDLTGPVPLGESEDEGYIIHEEDPELAPPS